jgi:hypothetical protein
MHFFFKSLTINGLGLNIFFGKRILRSLYFTFHTSSRNQNCQSRRNHPFHCCGGLLAKRAVNAIG